MTEDILNVSDLNRKVDKIANVTNVLQHISVYSQAFIGDYKYSARTDNSIGGWLKCNGQSISKTSYPALWDVIGYAFGGSGDNFNLPDFRGRVPGAIGSGTGLTERLLGQARGTETHTLTVDEMPIHNHGVTDNGHTHNVSNTVNFTGDGTPGSIDNSGGEIDTNTTFNTTSSSSTTGISIQNAGGGLAHNNMQPTLFGGNVYIFAGLIV